MLPKSLREVVAKQIEEARALWQNDREAGVAGVYLPGALARKFRQAAEIDWGFQISDFRFGTGDEEQAGIGLLDDRPG